MDVLVTTPQRESGEAAKEALDARAQGGYYFRNLGQHQPKQFSVGERVWYTEGGFVQGFGLCVEIVWSPGEDCDATGRHFNQGWFAWIPVVSWKWVRPFRYKGFQGFRYVDFGEPEIIGDWLDPKPEMGNPISDPTHDLPQTGQGGR